MPRKYFPTKKSFSCPLDRIAPDQIKSLYSDELSKNKIQRTSYYKLVAKTLGFHDWSEYQHGRKEGSGYQY